MKRIHQKSIAVIIPAYNEAKRIGKVLKSLPKKIKIKNDTFTIITVVVNDKSSDDTSIIARENDVFVIDHIINCGAGGATRTGMRFVQELMKDNNIVFAVTIDGDGQHKVEDIRKLLEEAIKTNADMIIGSRLHQQNNQSMPLHRTLGNVGLSFISKILFGIKAKDTQSGLRLYRADKLSIFSDFTIDRYGFCSEILWLAEKNNLSVKEVPITVEYSQETLSKGQNNWGVVDLLKDLIWIRIVR